MMSGNLFDIKYFFLYEIPPPSIHVIYFVVKNGKESVMSKTEMPQWSMVSSSVFPRQGTVGFSRCSGIPELHPEFSWDILADLPLTCLLVCPSLLTTKTPITPLPWKHTKMHVKGRELKGRARFKSSLSRCLSYSILSTPEMLRMAVEILPGYLIV